MVEKRIDGLRYTDLNMSVKEYQEYAYYAPRIMKDGDWTEIHTQKKVTNPPKIYEFIVRYLTVPYFSEEEKVVIPHEYLGEGVLAGMQTRELIGVVCDY